MRTLAHITVAFLLLILVGAFWRILPFDIVAPDVAIIIAVYLGASLRGRAWEITVAALMIGYLEDVLDGTPRGLCAFVVGATCLLTRLATGRLLVRGSLFTAFFVFAAAVVAAGLTLSARAAFGFGRSLLALEVMSVVGSAFLTSLLAPAVFRVCRTIDGRFARTEREREALREGFLT